MSSKSSVGFSRSTALGVSLLGLSATLFAVDVTGTLALERERDGAGAASRSAVASTYAPQAVVPAAGEVRAAALSNAAHVFAAPPAVAAVVPFVRHSPPPAKPSPLTKTIVIASTPAAASRGAHAVAGDGAVLRASNVRNGGGAYVARKAVEHDARGNFAPSVQETSAHGTHDAVSNGAYHETLTRDGVAPHTPVFVARKRVNEITSQQMSLVHASAYPHGERLLARETAEQQIPARDLQLANAATALHRRSSVDAVHAVHAGHAVNAVAITRIGLKPVTPSHAAASVVTLRDVRRFVMYELKKRDRHVCVISAMTYPVADRQVIVDLVFRDDKGRWSEKAVVRRGGNAVKLIGVKRQPLPYKIVAATGFAPSR